MILRRLAHIIAAINNRESIVNYLIKKYKNR